MAGEESASAMEADIIINAADGLPNMHPNLEQLQLSDGPRGPDDVDIHDDDLPTSLIVTNLNSVVFKSDDEKVEHNSIDFISTHSLADPFSPTASRVFSREWKSPFRSYWGLCILRAEASLDSKPIAFNFIFLVLCKCFNDVKYVATFGASVKLVKLLCLCT